MQHVAALQQAQVGDLVAVEEHCKLAVIENAEDFLWYNLEEPPPQSRELRKLHESIKAQLKLDKEKAKGLWKGKNIPAFFFQDLKNGIQHTTQNQLA